MTNNSFFTLNINSIPFNITRAHIKESLQDLFVIKCEGYIESLEEYPFNNAIGNKKNKSSLNFHPNTLINQYAIFSINNPYTSKENLSSVLLSINNGASSPKDIKEYAGIVYNVEYLGLNTQSSANMLNKNSQTNSLNYKHFFSFTLTSSLIRMSLNKANRIYTDKNIIDIIKATLGFHQQNIKKNLDFSHITSTYPKLELVSQYQESDLAFLKRIAYNNGIYFYEDTQNIYFYDITQRDKSRNVTFNPRSNNTLNEPCITSFYKTLALRTNSFFQSSENALNPFNLQSLSIKTQNQSDNEQENKNIEDMAYSQHNYTSQYSFSRDIDLKTPISLKERRLQVLRNSFQAQSNLYNLSLNESISVDFIHSIKESKDNLKDFIIVGIEHLLINESLLKNSFNTNDEAIKKDNMFLNNINSINKDIEDIGNISDGVQGLDDRPSFDNISSLDSSKTYSNILTLLPMPFSFAPSLRSKPKAPNSTLGIIIGEDYDIEKQRNTIYTDEYGRVRVRINCFANQEIIDNAIMEEETNNKDNLDATNSNNKICSYHYSPYLRVSSPIASLNAGFYHTPRVGDEVIISFLDDDIDRPYISGSLYNQNNSSLPSLPLESHQTTLSSKTVGLHEDGRNELTLSNLKGQEQVYLKAQKDYEELVQHNFTQSILNDKDSVVNGVYSERINKAHTQTIGLAKIVNIGGEHNTNVALSKDTIVGLSNTLNVGASNKLRVANSSSEYVGGDKEVDVGANLTTNIQKDESRSVNGNKVEIVNKHLSIHSNENLHLSANDELALISKNNLLFSTRQSCSLRSDENLTISVKDLYTTSEQDINYYATNNINLFISEDSNIQLSEDKIILKIKDSELVLDENGLSINKPVTIKKGK